MGEYQGSTFVDVFHMGLAEITNEGVEKAITEFDELGREAFGKLNA